MAPREAGNSLKPGANTLWRLGRGNRLVMLHLGQGSLFRHYLNPSPTQGTGRKTKHRPRVPDVPFPGTVFVALGISVQKVLVSCLQTYSRIPTTLTNKQKHAENDRFIGDPRAKLLHLAFSP